ncbi:MAG: hypothetical protein MUO50_14375 [Longimicrobiales bacterium]|nr:hypothetical protein [Longimicrobiales bacterium]
MRRFFRPLLILIALGLMSHPLRAQLVDLNDTRTAEEKWARSTVFVDFGWVMAIGHAKEMGQTVEEFARWGGKFGATTWGAPGETPMADFVQTMHRNYNIWSGLEFELLAESETEISGRMNTPYASFFGESGERLGVSLEEFRMVWLLMYEETADYLGFDMTHEVNGDWIEFTVKAR